MKAGGQATRWRIRLYGDPCLRRACRRVDSAETDLPDLIAAMRRLMGRNNGVGLAAPQLGDDRRLVVIEPPGAGRALVMLNPEISDVSADLVSFEEGCLSFPGLYRDVIRPGKVTLKWTDPDGGDRAVTDGGMLARIAQHEIDHLDGILFVDHLSSWERIWIRARFAIFRKRAYGGDFL